MNSKLINYRLLIELSICGLFLLIGVFFALFVKPEKPKSKPREYNYNDLILVDTREFDLNSALNLYDLISSENQVKIVSDNNAIDTSSVGAKNVQIQYNFGSIVKNKILEINITDKTGPIIAYNAELTTLVGKDIDLLDGVNAIDNSNSPIEVTVEGNYDFSRAGKYYLQYVAVDPSGNKTVEKFTLTVNRNTTVATKKTTSKTTSSKKTAESSIVDNTTEKTTEKTLDVSDDPNQEENNTSNTPKEDNEE